MLTEQPDKHKEIRVTALALYPDNWTAQTQEFRWLMATGQFHPAARWNQPADRFHFFTAKLKTAWFYAGYIWAKALFYTDTDRLDKAVEYYYLALSRASLPPDTDRVAQFYRTLAYSVLSDRQLPGPTQHLKAGKFFLLAEEPELALEQALQIDISGDPAPENSPAISWAGWMLARNTYQRGDTGKALNLLRTAIDTGKNSQAAALMLDLAERMDDEATADAARDCLVNLAPDWAIARRKMNVQLLHEWIILDSNTWPWVRYYL